MGQNGQIGGINLLTEEISSSTNPAVNGRTLKIICGDARWYGRPIYVDYASITWTARVMLRTEANKPRLNENGETMYGTEFLSVSGWGTALHPPEVLYATWAPLGIPIGDPNDPDMLEPQANDPNINVPVPTPTSNEDPSAETPTHDIQSTQPLPPGTETSSTGIVNSTDMTGYSYFRHN